MLDWFALCFQTWRKTVAGASKMFVVRHRTNHVLLISDMV
jgi:hypothetical protein